MNERKNIPESIVEYPMIDRKWLGIWVALSSLAIMGLMLWPIELKFSVARWLFWGVALGLLYAVFWHTKLIMFRYKNRKHASKLNQSAENSAD